MMENVVMHGTGNRFLIHCGDQEPACLLKELDGADGLLILSIDDDSDLFMRVFNADGSEVQQCGNGLRCAALHAFRNKLVSKSDIIIRTISGMNKCHVRQEHNEVEVVIGQPTRGAASCSVQEQDITDLPTMQFVNMGNPNAVLWTEDDPINVREEFGELITSHSGFGEGINLHVARLETSSHATIASWERGVGPTLSSGTGGASVFVSSQQDAPFVVTSLGGSLTYFYADDGQIVMVGPAAYV